MFHLHFEVHIEILPFKQIFEFLVHKLIIKLILILAFVRILNQSIFLFKKNRNICISIYIFVHTQICFPDFPEDPIHRPRNDVIIVYWTLFSHSLRPPSLFVCLCLSMSVCTSVYVRTYVFHRFFFLIVTEVS